MCSSDLDGVITVEFGLRESSDLEKRIKSLEETQAIQDRAIAGLGEAISEAEKEGDK